MVAKIQFEGIKKGPPAKAPLFWLPASSKSHPVTYIFIITLFFTAQSKKYIGHIFPKNFMPTSYNDSLILRTLVKITQRKTYDFKDN